MSVPGPFEKAGIFGGTTPKQRRAMREALGLPVYGLTTSEQPVYVGGDRRRRLPRRGRVTHT